MVTLLVLYSAHADLADRLAHAVADQRHIPKRPPTIRYPCGLGSGNIEFMDPNPFKHPAIILAKIRTAIEPSLLAAGFRFDGRNKPSKPLHLYLDYSRQGELFRLSWDRRDSNRFIGFTADVVGESEGSKTFAKADLSGLAKLPKSKTTAEVQMRIDLFVEAVNAFLNNLASSKGP